MNPKKSPMKTTGIAETARIVLAVLTVLCGIFAGWALYMVWGDKLLYNNSRLGYLASSCYKWAIAAFMLLLLVDMMFIVINRKKKVRKE